MEIKTGNEAPWLNPRHPNFKRWQRSRENSIDRGMFVISVIERYIRCKGLKILDIGSGEGGTSAVLSAENQVISFDICRERLERQTALKPQYRMVMGDIITVPFKNNSFDLIILQDVIEHVASADLLMKNVLCLLKPGGYVYISTPNKFSVFNLIADPHWGMPVVSLLNREMIKKYVLKFFRKDEISRNDIAQLYSLKDLTKIIPEKFIFILNTRYSLERLIGGDKGIAWSNFHMYLLKFAGILSLNKLLIRIANDKQGMMNNYFTPTFYIFIRENNSGNVF